MPMPNLLLTGPADAPVTFVFAHGAGAAMDSPFMEAVAHGLGEAGIRVARFEFPYMAARRTSGTRKAPDREPVLRQAWHDAFTAVGGEPGSVAIGGKSLGGRMASLVADELGAKALACFGFPFHAPGREPGTRILHLPDLRTPALILQGTRDPFGTPEDVAGYDLSAAIRVHWLEDGDHDLKPRAASGRSWRQNRDEAIAEAAAFLLA
jgi:predicted alpha/beta-hydrolase family hydrolase